MIYDSCLAAEIPESRGLNSRRRGFLGTSSGLGVRSDESQQCQSDPSAE